MDGFLSSFLEMWFKEIFEKFQDSENLCDVPQYDLHSIFGSCSSNHSDTHGTSNLNGGIANRTTGSMNQNCFAGLSLLIWNIRWIISVRQCYRFLFMRSSEPFDKRFCSDFAVCLIANICFSLLQGIFRTTIQVRFGLKVVLNFWDKEMFATIIIFYKILCTLYWTRCKSPSVFLNIFANFFC